MAAREKRQFGKLSGQVAVCSQSIRRDSRMSDADHILTDPAVAWRAVVLYGRNVATYKIALGQALGRLVADGKSRVTLDELSAAFLDLYVDRLKNGKPQLLNTGRLT